MVGLFILLGVLVFYRRSTDRVAAAWSVADARPAGMMQPEASPQLEPGWRKLREWAPVLSVIVALLALGVAATILVTAELSRIEDRHDATIEDIRTRVQKLIEGVEDRVEAAETLLGREIGAARIDLVVVRDEFLKINTRLAVIETLLARSDAVRPAVEPPEPEEALDAPEEAAGDAGPSP
jgi:hypothetical protein